MRTPTGCPKQGELWGDARCAAVLVAPHHHAAPVARAHAALTVGVRGRREQHHTQSEDDLLSVKWWGLTEGRLG